MSQLIITYGLELANITNQINENRHTVMDYLGKVVTDYLMGLDGFVDTEKWFINSPTPFLLGSIQDIASGLEQGLSQLQEQYVASLISQVNIIHDKNNTLINTVNLFAADTHNWMLERLGIALETSNYILEQVAHVYSHDLEAETTLLDVKIIEGMLGIASLISGHISINMENIILNMEDNLSLILNAIVSTVQTTGYIAQDLLTTVVELAKLQWAHTDESIAELKRSIGKLVMDRIDLIYLEGKPLLEQLQDMYDDIEEIKEELDMEDAEYGNFVKHFDRFFKEEKPVA